MTMNFDAVIFDMDGVITKTAVVHSIAWKKMFDEYLMFRESTYNEPFIEFTHTKKGVIPDHEIIPTLQEVLAKKDIQLDWVMEKIKEDSSQ